MESTRPPNKDLPHGQMGRRIMVRWDLTVGPDDRDQVVLLPGRSRFTVGELRPTLCEIRSVSLQQIMATMNDQAN